MRAFESMANFSRYPMAEAHLHLLHGHKAKITLEDMECRLDGRFKGVGVVRAWTALETRCAGHTCVHEH
jgi:hypothetical protein